MTADPDAPPRGRRRTRGRRQRRRRQQRRRRLTRSLLVVIVFAGLAAGGFLLASNPVTTGSDAPDSVPTPTANLGDQQPAVVFATFDEEDRTAGASLLFILARRTGSSEDGAGASDGASRATLLFVPTDTLADIPGHGLDRIGRSLAFGGPALLDATLDNLLGVDFDGVATISEQGWASAFARIDGLTVEVEERLIATEDDGTRQVRFEPGEQHLDGPRLAELLTFTAADEEDLSRLPRAQRVLVTLLRHVAEDPDALDAMFSGASLFDGPVDDEQLRTLLTGAAAAVHAETLEVLTLPVSPIGSGEDQALRIDDTRAQALVSEHFAASVPAAAASGASRLQILNGDGTPGIGQAVAEQLVPAGFRVVITDNADSFDHDTTKILVYREDPELLARARQIRDLLGVGEVIISRTPQSVVDVTVVVGHDYASLLDATPAESPD